VSNDKIGVWRGPEGSSASAREKKKGPERPRPERTESKTDPPGACRRAPRAARGGAAAVDVAAECV